MSSLLLNNTPTRRPSFSGVDPHTIGCVWTVEFDLNTLRVDGEIFESGKKKFKSIQVHVDGGLYA